jgi:SAM-dependent methyltransferase
MLHLGLRSAIKRFLPKSVVRINDRWVWGKIRQQYAVLPVPDAFSEVYRTKRWGEAEGEEFCSGAGSGERFSVPYADWVTRFISDKRIAKVVDLGCGDFRVGRRICRDAGFSYIGIDVVQDLIAHNNARFGRDGLEFRYGNLIADELPDGDLCLIRQVLQHLSNAQISAVLKKCAKFPYLVITEDVYAGRSMRPNLDKPHGPDNRLLDRSGVYLDLPPFSLSARTVLELPSPETDSVIRTSLIEMTAPLVPAQHA